MTHYSNYPGHVQVLFFKPSGKRYTEEMLDMTNYWSSDAYLTPEAAVDAALNDQMGDRLRGMIAVVPDPYHEHAYPVCTYRGDPPTDKTLFDWGSQATTPVHPPRPVDPPRPPHHHPYA